MAYGPSLLRHLAARSLLAATLGAFGGCAAGGGADGGMIGVLTGGEAARTASYRAPSALMEDGAAGAPAGEPAGEERAEATGFRPELQGGTLTAGDFDDLADFAVFDAAARPLREDQEFGGLVAPFLERPTVLRVVGRGGEPVGGAVVSVAAAEGEPILRLVTKSDGRAVILPGWDHLPRDQACSVAVLPPGGPRATTRIEGERERQGGRPAEVVVRSDAAGGLPAVLDLAFVVDCTGSMGDELEYLKVELREIAGTIDRRFPGVRKRYALVAYRDEGDEYVSRAFDFTESLRDFERSLGRQSAAGGGDEPEAVHAAFARALQLRWSPAGEEEAPGEPRAPEAARVLFWVADAPPHRRYAREALAGMDALRKRGVAIYPVAASGVRAEAELLMRSAAMMTGSRYVFLTDDSGVGNSHAEPHIPFYRVQRLKDVLIRLTSAELAGHPIEPTPAEVLRTVDVRQRVEEKAKPRQEEPEDNTGEQPEDRDADDPNPSPLSAAGTRLPVLTPISPRFAPPSVAWRKTAERALPYPPPPHGTYP